MKTTPSAILTTALRVASGLGLIVLAACADSGAYPQTEYDYFAVPQGSKRNMQAPKVEWMIRADARDYCAKVMHFHSRDAVKPLACATWSRTRNTCTVVTSDITNRTIVGHELRHCFEGNFHA